jgi:nucleoside-diphosphate-sugar epimerase
LGVEPFLLRIEPSDDADSVGSVEPFFSSDCVVVDIPPEAALGPDFHPEQIATILSFIERAERRPSHLLYVSSVSVYGPSQGPVDERTQPLPDQGSGSILLEAEQKLSRFARERAMGLTIVRPGGLIGPGRHPGLFLAGRKGVLNGTTPVNMIHQLDLCEMMTSLIVDHPTAAGEVEIYNAVSPHHPLRSEFYSRASVAIGVEPPSFASSSCASPKIVSSEKIRRVTGCTPRFDDLYGAIGAL